jgi:HlyD family secretion protein
MLVVSAAGIGGCSGDAGTANPAGTLEATVIDLAPIVDGRVLEVRADEGDVVAMGDTLVVVDTELLALQRDQASARVRSVEAQEAEARERLRQVRRELELTETTLARTRPLVAQGSASEQQLDELVARRDVASSQVAAAEARLSVLDAQKREFGRTIALVERQLRDGTVLAPVDGTVIVRMIEPGEVTRAGAPALRIADLRVLELRVYLEATDLDLVRLGQAVSVRVDAIENSTLDGTVSWIASEAEFTPKNAQTREARAQLVYAVKVRVPNPDRRLHIGQPAEVVLGS